jgi:hypothetical protein
MKHPIILSCEKIINRDEAVTARADEVRARLFNLKVVRVEGAATKVSAKVAPNPKFPRAETYYVTLDFADKKRSCNCEAHQRYLKPCKHQVALAQVVLEVLSLTA